MEITLYAETIDDVSATSTNGIAVELSGVDLSALITEIGVDELLEEIGLERIKQHTSSIEDIENE